MNNLNPNEPIRIGNHVYMEAITCKKCGGTAYVKAGLIHGKQRYKCKHCLYLFLVGHKKTATKEWWKPPNYAPEGMSQGIGRILNTSYVTILNWMKRTAEKLKPPTPTHARHIEINEPYFYVGSKKRKRWLWLAICRYMKKILGFCTGGRAERHWESAITAYQWYQNKKSPNRSLGF